MPELSGQWLGKLIYDQSFGELEHESLVFTLEIISGEEGFSGVSKDVDGIGINTNPATVKGFIEENSINFIKKYTPAPRLNNDHKLVEDKNHKGPELSFTGSWDAESGEFSGEWIIVESYAVYSNVFYENCGGRWSMKRVLSS